MKKLILYIVFCTVICSSCKDDLAVAQPELDIRIVNNKGSETLDFKIGDTINFIFKGNPDNITFYSGDVGSRYDYEGVTSDVSGKVEFAFSTLKNTNGNGELELLVANDFERYTGKRKADSLSILKANWKNISNLANWASGSTKANSGVIDLTGYIDKNKPLSFAFRYTAPAGAPQSKYTIDEISLRHFTRGTSYLLDSTMFIVPTNYPSFQTSAGWGRTSMKNTLIKFQLFNGASNFESEFSGNNTTSFAITGNTTNAAVETESWLVSGPIDLTRVMPEVGVTIKDRTENAEAIAKGFYSSSFANYTFKYAKTGTYDITFKISSSSAKKTKEIIKKYKITISN